MYELRQLPLCPLQTYDHRSNDSVTAPAMRTLVHPFFTSRLDYCNASLAGCSSTVLHLQSVLNAAARHLLQIPKFSCVTAAMRDVLHWLPVRQRITFKLCYIVHSCVVGVAPVYLQELCVHVSEVALCQRLRSST